MDKKFHNQLKTFLKYLLCFNIALVIVFTLVYLPYVVEFMLIGFTTEIMLSWELFLFFTILMNVLFFLIFLGKVSEDENEV